MNEARDHLRDGLDRFVREVAPDLPLPGRGDTAARFAVLADLGQRDLSLTRLCEAHADAVAILADHGRDPAPDASYGVWAARSRDDVVTAERVGHGWHLSGRKPWCTGVGIVTRALVTAESAHGPILVDLALDDPGVTVAATPWATAAFGATNTVTLALDLDVADDQQIAAAGSYLDRPGFWHGASGVAACWAGGLRGLADRAAPWWRNDPHAAAHRAAVDAQAWAVTVLVAAAGRDADAHPRDLERGHRTALRLRHLVDAAVTESITRVRRGCGPAPLASDAEVARHIAELELYVRQSHAERDLEALGRLLTPS